MSVCTICEATQGQPHSPLCSPGYEKGCLHPSHCAGCGGATWRDGPVKMPPMPPPPPMPRSSDAPISRARRGDLVLARYVPPGEEGEREVWVIGRVARVDPRTGYVTCYKDHRDRLIKLREGTERRVLSQRQLAVDSSVVVEAAEKLHGGRFDTLEEARALVRTFCA